MRQAYIKIFFLFLISISLTFCNNNNSKVAIEKEDSFVKDNYDKKEVKITMRDGIKLHTTIYSPKDQSKTYPILLQRTPYSCSPYGDVEFRKNIGPNINLMKQGNRK
jgi:predicted acyl esterase